MTGHPDDFSISDDDVAFYREHGYVVVGPVFDLDQLDDAQLGAERFHAGDWDYVPPAQIERFRGWQHGDGDGMRVSDYGSLHVRELAQLVLNPALGAIAAQLVGRGPIRLFHDQLIWKPPGHPDTTAVGWHTDRAYWPTCSSDQMLTAWIPLQASGPDNGGLEVVPGSHRWPDPQQRQDFHARGPTPPPADAIALQLSAGQVSFHHCRTLHGSRGNQADTARISLSVHLQDADNRWRSVPRPDGSLAWHHNDVLCRKADGTPDYADPDICPVVWPPPRGSRHG